MPSTAANTNQPATIQCFKPGRHTDMRGTALAFAASDLAATAAAYNPALWRAPLVVGHPSTDAPAYGHVAALAHAGGALEATPELVNAEFAAQVQAQAYTGVSACFWRPQAPGNPVPGVYYLRHVGFLGGVPPAIMGMRPPAFAADQLARYSAPACDLVEFSAWDEVDSASLWRGLRDWLLGKFGQADADAALPGYLVQSVERAAQDAVNAEASAKDSADPAPAAALPSFSQAHQLPETAPVTEAEKTALLAENATLKQQIKDTAASAQTAVLAAARSDGVAFADSLVAQDRLAVDHRDAVAELFASLAAAEQTQGAVLQYGAADARAPLLPVVKQLLGGLPVRVLGQRQATTGRAAGDAGDAADSALAFSAPPGAIVRPERVALFTKAKAHIAAHPGTEFAAACRAVGA